MGNQPPPTSAASLDAVRERPGGRSARIRKLVLEATRAEILAGGYGGLSHRLVAVRAGVDPATVYRRWPTRPRLAADALLAAASHAVPVPDTGDIEGDLDAFLGAIVVALSDPGMLRFFHALSAARAEAEGDLIETLRRFWETRFEGAEQMVARAVRRGELPEATDPHAFIEGLVAPAYLRALVTGEGFDPGFAQRCRRSVLAGAGGR